jgi:D-glycero-D-manno-heptose 1,7-bisphosphate phosphatase
MLQPSNIHRFNKLRTIFLDRDGVLNKKMPEGQYVRSWEEFHLLPGVPEAIALLNRRGLRVVVVSNQRGIALKFFRRRTCWPSTRGCKLSWRARARTSTHFTFAHTTRGKLPQAAAEFPDISAATSVMIGDSRADMEFGARLEMPTNLIEGAQERQSQGIEEARALARQRFPSLVEAVNVLLQSQL